MNYYLSSAKAFRCCLNRSHVTTVSRPVGSVGPLFTLSDEAAVQDLLYLILCPWLKDLSIEEPTGRVTMRFTICDFISRSARLLVEAKFVGSKGHGRSLDEELHDDIETYRYHQHCDDLIFFIYDPDQLILDAQKLARHITMRRTYEDGEGHKKSFRCHAVILPG